MYFLKEKSLRQTVICEVYAYGATFVVQYNKEGEFIEQSGDKGKLDEPPNQSHGITIDTRTDKPTRLVTSRRNYNFKRFSLDGDYIESLLLKLSHQICSIYTSRLTLFTG